MRASCCERAGRLVRGDADEEYTDVVNVKIFSATHPSFLSEPRLLALIIVGAAQRAGSRAFQKFLPQAGPGTGKRYVGAGAGRRPGKARPGFQVWQPCGSCT